MILFRRESRDKKAISFPLGGKGNSASREVFLYDFFHGLNALPLRPRCVLFLLRVLARVEEKSLPVPGQNEFPPPEADGEKVAVELPEGRGRKPVLQPGQYPGAPPVKGEERSVFPARSGAERDYAAGKTQLVRRLSGTEKMKHGGKEIREKDFAFDLPPPGKIPVADDKGYAEKVVEKIELVIEKIVVSDALSVIRGDDQEGVRGGAVSLEKRDQLSHRGVDFRHFGEIEVAQVPDLFSLQLPSSFKGSQLWLVMSRR